MMVNIYDTLHAAYAGSLIPDPVKFAAIEDEYDITLFERRKLMDDLGAPGQKTIIARCFILIVDCNLLTHIRKHLIQGQLRSQRIAIKPDM
jgi:hypothetical protein